MDIIHRISFHSDYIEAFNFFKKMRINLKTTSNRISFDIGENNINWNEINNFINNSKEKILIFQFHTIFSKEELENASYYEVSPKWHFEYPQPEENFSYKDITYDSNKMCDKCAIGLNQIKPFLLKKNPKWGKRNITQLNWVFDEYFISGNLKNSLKKENCNLKFKMLIITKKIKY